jgi:hypothetical protein
MKNNFIMNTIEMICPYQLNGQWMFDDDRHGLVREPFVFGAEHALDYLSLLVGAAYRLKVFFSASPLPQHHFLLTWLSGDGSAGAWYETNGGNSLWLCPALLNYFNKPPQTIYVFGQADGEVGSWLPPADAAELCPA